MPIAKCFKILHKELGSIVSKEFLQINKKMVKTQYMKLTLMHLKKTIKDVFCLGGGRVPDKPAMLTLNPRVYGRRLKRWP